MMMDVYRERQPVGCCTNFLRGLLMIINALFVAVSAAGVAVGVLIMVHKASSVIKYCDMCSHISMYGVGVFGGLLVFCLWGFCALYTRKTCMLNTYAFFLFFFFLASMALLVLVLFVHEGHFDGAMKTAWSKSINASSSDVCEFEKTVQCTGWTAPCTEFVWNATANCPKCAESQYVDLVKFNATTCQSVFTNDFKKYFLPVLGTSVALVLLTLTSIIVTCSIRSKFQEYNELNERL